MYKILKYIISYKKYLIYFEMYKVSYVYGLL